MTLLDHIKHSGDWLFRWRSYLPLLILPVVLLGLADGPAAMTAGSGADAWGVACLVLALLGLAIRVAVIGVAPRGTSERSTSDPRASLLNTRGPYSVVRHPLYVANTVIALGLACFPAAWYVPVIVILASLLYYERIAVREEVFLEGRFGDEFREWAARVPALVPRLGAYQPALSPFRWRNVLGREFHALFVIGAGFLVLDAGRALLRTGQLTASPLWMWVASITGAIFLVFSAIKKTTNVFAERAEGSIRQQM